MQPSYKQDKEDTMLFCLPAFMLDIFYENSLLLLIVEVFTTIIEVYAPHKMECALCLCCIVHIVQASLNSCVITLQRV